MALQDARLDEIDAEEAVDFAVALAFKADRMWLQGNLDQRQRLQQALFPDGLLCQDNRLVRTPTEPFFFMEIAAAQGDQSRLVGFLRRMDALRGLGDVAKGPMRIAAAILTEHP
jgi:hypothetical protein